MPFLFTTINENLQRNYNIMRGNFKINLVFLELIEFVACYLFMLWFLGLSQMEPEIGSEWGWLVSPSLGQTHIWQVISPDIFWAYVCCPKNPKIIQLAALVLSKLQK